MKSAERMKYFRPSVFSRLDEEKRRLQEKGEKIIDLPRPRDIASPEFIELREYVTKQIKWW